jgi:DMSO/TMAO reductase YedYZ molybdopterin-dependent catalytic subunit
VSSAPPRPWPPGQRERADFPRFGTTQFARRLPAPVADTTLEVRGRVGKALDLVDPLRGLPRIEQVLDFHCVTTWSRRGLRFGGVRFVDFFEQVLRPQVQPAAEATLVQLRGADGAYTGLLLEDLLAPDVMLADTLDSAPLSLAHGAPLRLVAPAHYGYKWVKHLMRLEFRRPDEGYRVSAFAFMDHPRARTALEERGRGAPGWLLRRLYRPLIAPTVWWFRRNTPR